MADTHKPAKGDQYRNKETIPGYAPGLLVIQVIDTPTPSMVDYVVIESNRLRTGPFVGVTGAYPIGYLDMFFEFMPMETAEPVEGEQPLGYVPPVLEG